MGYGMFINENDLRDALAATVLTAGTKAHAKLVIGSIRITKTAGSEKTPGTVTFLSTDTHRATIVTVQASNDDAGEEFDTLIATHEAARLLKTFPRRRTARRPVLPVVLHATTNGLTVTDLDRVTTEYDGPVGYTAKDFPNMGHLAPTGPTVASPVRLNPKYLADLAEMPGVGKLGMEVSFYGERKPVVARWEDARASYEHVIMPIREY